MTTAQTADPAETIDAIPDPVGASGPARRPMSPLRRTVDVVGRILIGIGVLVLLFTAYQVWGTSLQEQHTQSQLRSTLEGETNQSAIRHALAVAAALDKLPTGPPRTAPRTIDPPEGTPIGDIDIPVIGVNQVVVEGTNTPDLRKGPGHYIGTPLPGQNGNAGVAGHRTTYGHPFYNLDGVKPGDHIVVTTVQGIFVYDAFRSTVVSPTDASVIKNVFANWLTLTTCNPRFSASTRLVVQAKLVHSQLFPNSGLVPGSLHADPQSGSLAGDNSVQLTDSMFWGALVLCAIGAAVYAGWRFRKQRWFIWGAGSALTLVLLWFFFGAVSPLLPASF